MCKNDMLLFVALMMLGAGVKGDSLKLLLPPAIYATPGVESNVYFDNIVLTLNPNNYFFDVDCAKGRNDAKRWTYVPKSEEKGEYPWKVKVLNSDNQVVAEGETIIIVTPVTDLNKDRTLTLLMVGDSLTNAARYPRRVNELFQSEENPSIKFIGGHAGGGKPAGKDGVVHEGYGGWTWGAFSEKWDEKGDDYRAKSPFLTVKDGKKTLDFQAYFDKRNKGKAPDYVTFMLGTNDVFKYDDESIDDAIKVIFKNMDTLLDALVEAAPKAKIGVALTPPPAASQDAFGHNYKCGQTRWQYKRNQHKLVETMMKKFSECGNKNISMVPVYVSLDTENGFPLYNLPIVHGSKEKTKRLSNGVHPADLGYRQIGDSFYNWLVFQEASQAK